MPDYSELRRLLEKRLGIISNTELRNSDPELQLRQLQEVSEKISFWLEESRSQIPAQLNHFLKQSSLSKALEFIEKI